MCGFWDPRTNDYHHGQEWGYDAGKDSMWGPQVVEDAKACVEGLTNMLSSLTSWRAASNQEPLVALQPLASNYKLRVMLAWCKSVAGGRMQRGPCLHTPICKATKL